MAALSQSAFTHAQSWLVTPGGSRTPRLLLRGWPRLRSFLHATGTLHTLEYNLPEIAFIGHSNCGRALPCRSSPPVARATPIPLKEYSSPVSLPSSRLHIASFQQAKPAPVARLVSPVQSSPVQSSPVPVQSSVVASVQPCRKLGIPLSSRHW